ncbi:MAG: hypothetical protein ACR2L1_03800 [Pyrinomonadaceae bacterium]
MSANLKSNCEKSFPDICRRRLPNRPDLKPRVLCRTAHDTRNKKAALNIQRGFNPFLVLSE